MSDYNQTKIELNKKNIKKSIDESISSLNERGIFNRDNLFKAIINSIKLGKINLDLDAYQPTNMMSNGYAKFAIYDSVDKEYPFSIWIFAFGYKQKTPIHDHNTACSTALISDTNLEEKLYEIQNIDCVNRTVLSKEKRRIYDVKKDDGHISGQTSIIAHRLKNQDEDISVTIHIYDMPMYKLESKEFSSSVENRYEKSPAKYQLREKEAREKKLSNLYSRL